MKKLLIPSVIITLSLLFLSVRDIRANTYYVSPTGSGSSCTYSSPCSQSTGNSKLNIDTTPPYILYFKSGKYIQTSAFSVSKSTALVATAPNEPTKAILTGDTNNDGKGDVPANSSWSGMVVLSGSNIVFNNLEVAYSGSWAVNVTGSNVTVSDNYIHHSWRTGIQVNGPGATIENNTVYRASETNWCGGTNNIRKCNGDWEAGISWGLAHDGAAAIPGAARNIKVRNNTVYNTSGEGIICMHNGGNTVNDGGIVDHNTVYDNWATSIYLDQCSNVTVSGNLVYYSNDFLWWRDGNPQGGIHLCNENILPRDNSPVYPIGHNRIIINNIVAGAGSNFRFLTHTGTTGYMQNDLIANNTFVEARNNGYGFNITPALNGNHSNVRIINNIVIQSTGNPGNIPSSGFTLANNLWSKSPGVNGTNELYLNVLGLTPKQVLVNPVAGNGIVIDIDPAWFKLINGSPGINTGKQLTEVATDYFDVLRNNPPDIGAHEYSGTIASITATLTITNTLTPKLGDTNNDNLVNGYDYNIWNINYQPGVNKAGGKSVADFNTDTIVNGIDFVIWVNNYGK